MKHLILFILALFLCGQSFAQFQCNYAHYEGQFEEGTSFIADLTFTGQNIEGYYYYKMQKQVENINAIIYGDWIYLQGNVKGDNIFLYEVIDGDTGAIIKAKINHLFFFTGEEKGAICFIC